MFAVSVSESTWYKGNVFGSNCIKTNPDEGWFTILHLYGPLKPIHDKTWKPNDIERVKSIGGESEYRKTDEINFCRAGHRNVYSAWDCHGPG